jgi:hypothetical protein
LACWNINSLGVSCEKKRGNMPGWVPQVLIPILIVIVVGFGSKRIPEIMPDWQTESRALKAAGLKGTAD